MSVKEIITRKLEEAFNPQSLEVINESHQHSVAPGSETHFKLVIVSEKFEGMPPVQRHRTIFELLKKEMENGIHALAIHPMTPQELQKKNLDELKSPPCLGGSKS
ncbi:BolA family transcriptional regulator [bacterium]|nr:BolA family transcriptional regulator [bacterium]